MDNIIFLSDILQKKKRTGGGLMCAILEKIKDKTPLELLKEYNIDLKLPINLSLLLDRIGVSVIAKDFTLVERECEYEIGSILGAAISKDNNLAIFYRKSDTYNRKIFTIAHELGHCCKHADNLKISHIELRTSNTALDPHEIEANIFAGELLIPENLLKQKYNDFIIPSLKALSQLFGVSSTVMAARLDHLNLSYFKDVNISEE